MSSSGCGDFAVCLRLRWALGIEAQVLPKTSRQETAAIFLGRAHLRHSPDLFTGADRGRFEAVSRRAGSRGRYLFGLRETTE
jgi:hypothetical protein